MRYYSGNRLSSGNKKKILFRVLFVILSAVIITAITLAIGNHLKEKVERAENETKPLHVSTGLTSERHLDENALYSDYSPTVFGTGIDVSDYLGDGTREDGTPADIAADVHTIAEHYDTLTIVLTDESGTLIYDSAAMCGISHIPYAGQSEAEGVIRSALGAAKDDGMRTCAVILPIIFETTVSGAVAVDSELVKELHDMGFDEVLLDLTGMFDGEIATDDANRIRSYLRECASLSNDVCRLGVMLSDDEFLNSANAKQIQLIADTASFIAIKFNLEEAYITTSAYNSVSNAVTSLLGNFSVYNMRVIIDSRFDLICAAVYSACTTHGVSNVTFMRYIEPGDLEYSDPSLGNVPAKDDETPSEPEDNTNPYATTSQNPSIGAPPVDGMSTPASGGNDGNSDDNDEIGGDRPWY